MTLALLALVVTHTSVALGLCPNRRFDNDVISTFNARVEHDFVGQSHAVRMIREHLQDFVHGVDTKERPVVLQLVGPSGTGKTFMAELIANSIYDDCISTSNLIKGHLTNAMRKLGSWLHSTALAPSVGSMDPVKPLLTRSCTEDSAKLEDWRQACGIVTATFAEPQEGSSTPDAQNEGILRSFLRKAAQVLEDEPRVVLVLDDFVYCKGSCVSMLKDLLTKGVFSHPDKGDAISAKQSLIVLTTDLREFGLLLDPSQTYQSAVDTVQQAIEDYWGADSFIPSVVTHIPFTPLTNLELLKIVDQIVIRVARQIKHRIDKNLNNLLEEGEKPRRWDGIVRCPEHVKQEILDHLHDKTSVKDARALTEELYESLKRSVQRPMPIEKRLVKFKESASSKYSSEDIEIRVIPGDTLRTTLEVI